jgi:hypothetical protein
MPAAPHCLAGASGRMLAVALQARAIPREQPDGIAAMRIERVIDVVLLAGLIGVMISTPSVLVRVAMLVAGAMLVLGWFVAWRRRS